MKRLMFILLIFLIGCASTGNVSLVSPEDFESKMNEDVFVINTHTPYIGEIEGTDLIIEDWQNVAKYKEELPEDKTKPILIYCRSGSMSASASQQLLNMGYKNIYDLKGGMNAWKESGRGMIIK